MVSVVAHVGYYAAIALLLKTVADKLLSLIGK